MKNKNVWSQELKILERWSDVSDADVPIFSTLIEHNVLYRSCVFTTVLEYNLACYHSNTQ